MKITDIRFGMLRVPLKTPFKTARRTVDTVPDVFATVGNVSADLVASSLVARSEGEGGSADQSRVESTM